jgi:hypothetical protein
MRQRKDPSVTFTYEATGREDFHKWFKVFYHMEVFRLLNGLQFIFLRG